MLTAAHLQALGLDASWLDPLNATFDRFAINTRNAWRPLSASAAMNLPGFIR